MVFPALDDEEYELDIPSIGQPSQSKWIDDEVAAARKRVNSIRTLGLEDDAKLGRI